MKLKQIVTLSLIVLSSTVVMAGPSAPLTVLGELQAEMNVVCKDNKATYSLNEENQTLLIYLQQPLEAPKLQNLRPRFALGSEYNLSEDDNHNLILSGENISPMNLGVISVPKNFDSLCIRVHDGPASFSVLANVKTSNVYRYVRTVSDTCTHKKRLFGRNPYFRPTTEKLILKKEDKGGIVLTNAIELQSRLRFETEEECTNYKDEKQ